MSETVEISVERLGELEEAEDFLNCLQAAGVDNWDGYEYAQEMMKALTKGNLNE